MGDKQMRLKLSKIFNWPKEDKLVNLEIQFYSGQSCALLARKPIQVPFLSNYLDLNLVIKIKYNPKENHVIVVIHRVKDANNTREVIGQAEINLDELQDRKIKYYTLGEMDKVLQIQLTEPRLQQRDDAQKDPYQTRKTRNQKFLEDRRKFLQAANRNQAQMKKSFAQKIFSLLNDQAPADQGDQNDHPGKYVQQYEPYREDLNLFQSFGNDHFDMSRIRKDYFRPGSPQRNMAHEEFLQSKSSTGRVGPRDRPATTSQRHESTERQSLNERYMDNDRYQVANKKFPMTQRYGRISNNEQQPRNKLILDSLHIVPGSPKRQNK